MFVGDYSFDLSGEHAELLGRIAKIVAQTKAPFLTTVNPQVLDKSFKLADDAAPAWQALRELPETVFLGLAVPRFLLRLPYGENTTSIDKFSYEEMPGKPEMSHYLWGNPALGCAALVAQTFHKAGWGCDPGTDLAIEDLTIHVYTVDGDQEVTLGEAWLARPQTEQLVKLGIMPLLCVRGKGAMQLLRLLSVAQPPAEHPACDLWGRWIESGVAPAPTVARAGGAKVGMVGEVPVKPRSGSSSAPAAAPAAAAPRPKIGPAGTVSAPPAAPPPTPAPPPAVEEPEPEPEPEETVAAETTEAAETTADEAPAAEEEMDPELAALLKQLE
jgi:type VI secretion system protein ImpC